MYCSHCGKQNPDTSSFCSYCGQSLTTAARPIQNVPYTQKKLSGLAVVLSFFWPGLGQMYNGQIGKGILLLILQGALIVFGVLTLVFLIGFPILLGAFALWAWNLYDAYNTAERINRGEISV